MDNETREKQKKAEELYLEGKPLIEIACIMGVPAGTIRRWKSTYKWGMESGSERSDEKSERSAKKANVRAEKGERSGKEKANVRAEKGVNPGKKSERSDEKSERPAKKANVRAEKGERSGKEKANVRAEKPELAAGDEMPCGNAELTEKQRLFCIYYVRSFNAAKAYQKAYQCDYKSAMANGSRMIRNDKVKDAIKRLKEERLESELFSMEDVLQKYRDIAFADMNDYVEIKGDRIRFKDSDNFDGTIVKKVLSGKSRTIERVDPMPALKWLAEHMGGDKDAAGDDGFLDALNAAAGEAWSDEDC